MNKLIPIIAISLIASILALWYVSNKMPIETKLAHTLIVGTNTDYAPFSFMSNKNTITGFDIDLINEVAQRLGKTIELHDMPFDALIPALQVGTIQVIAGGITPTDERAQRILFTKPYIIGDPLLIVSTADKPLVSLDQLKDKKVAVNEGYTADYYMSKVEGPQLIRFASPIESFMALESGRVDALVAAQNTAQSFINHYGMQKFSAVPIANTSDAYALALSKKYPELLEPLQKALDTIEKDGTLAQLKKKWNLQ